MREIKFRGKRKDNNEWIYGWLIKIEKGYYILPYNAKIEKQEYSEIRFVFIDTVFFVEVTPETIGQFTGLIDKNGREIYEGDICKLGDNSNYYLGVIKFKDSCFYWVGDNGIEYTIDSWNDVEVVGNIYDNKNLIKED